MRILRDCEQYIKEIDRELFQSGITVPVKHYQDKKLEGEDQNTKEIIGVSICISNPLKGRREMLEYIFKDEADKIEKYCIQEFKDRISPVPLNPGNSYKVRPDMWMQFIHSDKFSYCVTGDSQVLTKEGYRYITDLKEGDIVYDKLGCEVLIRKFVHLENKKVRTIKCWRGYSITGTLNHPIMTYNPKTKIKDWKNLEDIQAADYIQIFNKFSTCKTDFLKEEAKLFGMIYSDGHIYKERNNKISFINKNENTINIYCDLLDKLNYSYYKGFNNCNNSWQIRVHLTPKNNEKESKELATRLYKFLNSLHYLEDELLLEFLKGFILGDGSFNYKTNCITFCTNWTHIDQIYNIRLILLKLGYFGHLSEFKTKHGKALYVKVAGSQAVELNNKLQRVYNTLEKGHYKLRGVLDINGDIFIKVKDIIDHEESQDVYDISTNGSFICNHIVSHNTYSERLYDKWQHVIAALKDDKHSRQALMEVFAPEDLANHSKNTRIPCSVCYQYLIRNDQLHCIYTMRSNDYFGHHPIDIWLAAESIQYLVEQLKETYPELQTGKLYYQAGSLHAYQWDLKERLLF